MVAQWTGWFKLAGPVHSGWPGRLPTGSRHHLYAGLWDCIFTGLLPPDRRDHTFPWASGAPGLGWLALPESSSSSWCLNQGGFIPLFSRIPPRLMKQESCGMQWVPQPAHPGCLAPASSMWADEHIRNLCTFCWYLPSFPSHSLYHTVESVLTHGNSQFYVST